MNRIFLVLGLFFYLSLNLQNSLAATATHWKANTHLLPQYCKDRVTGHTKGPFTRWKRTFGETYIHIHHYCGGIYAEKMAKLTPNKKTRLRYLRDVVSEMKYVMPSCSVGCVLYTDLHTRLGWALSEQGNISEAHKHYQLAIKAKKKYAKAYAGLSDIYVKTNQLDKALNILKKGLSENPKSRMLKRRLKKLEDRQTK